MGFRKKKINQSNQANSGLTFSLSEYKKDVLLNFWIRSPNFEHLPHVCAGTVLPLQ